MITFFVDALIDRCPVILAQQWFPFKIMALEGAGHLAYVAPRVASPPTRSQLVEGKWATIRLPTDTRTDPRPNKWIRQLAFLQVAASMAAST